MDCFERLGFSYDLYTRTDQAFHHAVVQELFLKSLDNGHLYRKIVRKRIAKPIDDFCRTAMWKETAPYAAVGPVAISAMPAPRYLIRPI